MLKKKKTIKNLNRHIIGMTGAALGLWAAGATEYMMREVLPSMEPSPNEQVLYSFLISLPFAVLITVLITYHINKLKKQNKT